jgi:hypothetical protein
MDQKNWYPLVRITMAGAELSYGYSSMEKQLFKEKKNSF